MFSDNEKISGRQLYRAIVVTLAGPTLLICPLIARSFGANGFFVYGLAGFFSIIYTGLMLICMERVKETKASSVKSLFGTIIRVLVSIKLIFLAIGALYLIVDMVSGILLPETSTFMIILLVAAGLIYWNRGSIEASGRAFETVFYWVLFPIVIVLVLAVPKVDLDRLVPDFEMSFGRVLPAALLMWFIFTPAELLVLCRNHFVKGRQARSGVFRGIGVVILGNLVTYGVLLGIYGETGLNLGGTFPLLKVMQISGVPGDFVRRVDGFMSIFLVLSLFCSMVLLLDFLGINIWKIVHSFNEKIKIENKKKLVFSCVIVAIMSIAVLGLERIISDYSEDITLAENMEKKMVSGTELEERGFVMSVILGEETVTFELADYKDGKWQSNSTYVTMKETLLYDAEERYKDSGDKKLDFTHLRMIFIDEAVYDSNVTDENLQYAYEREKYAENILVCVLKGDLKNMAKGAIENGEAFAVKIENIMKNSGREKGMELYKIYLKRVSKEG